MHALIETHGGLREVVAIAAQPPPCCGGVRPLLPLPCDHSYLLALARANHGRLATLGHKLATEVEPEGMAPLALI